MRSEKVLCGGAKSRKAVDLPECATISLYGRLNEDGTQMPSLWLLMILMSAVAKVVV